MVKVAISGATGGVAQEVLDVLVARKKHEIILLSRNIIPAEKLAPCVTSVQTDYKNEQDLVKILQGVHTVLCFITSQSDPGSVSQKALIHAAVKVGVKRYAPSEWASSGFDHMPWYEGKAEIREHLAELYKEHKVLEYCLFHAGLLWDFHGRRAIVIDGRDGGPINLITIKDFTDVIASAVEFEGEWPVVGGIRADVLTVKQLVALGEKIHAGGKGSVGVGKIGAEEARSVAKELAAMHAQKLAIALLQPQNKSHDKQDRVSQPT